MRNFFFLNLDQVKQDSPQQLFILKQYGMKCRMSGFALLLGGACSLDKKFTGPWWLDSDNYDGTHSTIDVSGHISEGIDWVRYVGARPALKADFVLKRGIDCGKNSEGIREVKFLDYPQTIESKFFSWRLEYAYKKGALQPTGKKYVTDSGDFHKQFKEYGKFVSDSNYRAGEVKDNSPMYVPREHIEYEYNGQKYIRFVADKNCDGQILPDGRRCKLGEPYWVRVEPITWLIDEKANVALAKDIIFAGVPYDKDVIVTTVNGKLETRQHTIHNFMDENLECFLTEYQDDAQILLENNTPITAENDTQVLLNRIDELIKTLPPKEKEIVLGKRNAIIKKYEDTLNATQRVGFEELKEIEVLTLEEDINPEVSLYTDLYDLISMLSSQESLVKRIKQIASYLEIFKSPITELPKETLTKEDMIKAITFYSNKYPGYRGNSFKDKLEETLISYKEQCEEDLKNFHIVDPKEPTLEHTEFDQEQKLLDTIMQTLDKAVAYNENIGEIVDFVESLAKASKGEIANQGDSNSMASIVAGAKTAIESLEGKRKEALERQLQEIVDKKIAKINEMLDTKESLTPEDIKEAESTLAFELQPFLVKLDKEANRQVSLKNITLQIANSRRILEEKEREENEPLGVIDSFTTDIHNSLLSGKVLASDKDKTVNLVTAALNRFSNALDDLSEEQIKAINNLSYPIDEAHPLTVLQSSLAEISNLLIMHNQSQKNQASQSSGVKK